MKCKKCGGRLKKFKVEALNALNAGNCFLMRKKAGRLWLT